MDQSYHAEVAQVMNRGQMAELSHLRHDCALLYERVSRPVLNRLVALDTDAFWAEMARGFVLSPTGMLVPRQRTPAEEKLHRILELRQRACFRPFLERSAKLARRPIAPAEALKQALVRLGRLR
jgi:hypothetical protein